MTEASKPVRMARTPAVSTRADKSAPEKGTTAVRKKVADVRRGTTQPSPDRVEQVRLAAYLRAERRGFVSGLETEDWLAAEAEVSSVTASAHDAK